MFERITKYLFMCPLKYYLAYYFMNKVIDLQRKKQTNIVINKLILKNNMQEFSKLDLSFIIEISEK